MVSTAPLFPLSAHRPLVPSAPLGVPGSSGVASALAVPVHPAAPFSAPPLFRPFALDPSPSSLPVSSAPPPPVSYSLPSFSACASAYPDSSTPPDHLALSLVIRMTSRRILLLTSSLAFLTLAFPRRFRIPLVLSFAI